MGAAVKSMTTGVGWGAEDVGVGREGNVLLIGLEAQCVWGGWDGVRR